MGYSALQMLLEKTSDASMLRDMISFAAERLMALETVPLCGTAPGERHPEIFNTDQGCQFTSADFTDVLRGAQVRISMDGRGR